LNISNDDPEPQERAFQEVKTEAEDCLQSSLGNPTIYFLHSSGQRKSLRNAKIHEQSRNRLLPLMRVQACSLRDERNGWQPSWKIGTIVYP
jgi:hypothetical protein